MKKLKILIFPEFPNSSIRSRYLLKLAWYLSPCLECISQIQIDCKCLQSPRRYLDFFDSNAQETLPHISNLLSASKKVSEGAEDSDIVLAWRSRSIKDLKKFLPNVPVFDVDDQYQAYSASNFIRAANFIQGYSSSQSSSIAPHLSAFLSTHQGSRVLLLGTGPNLEQVYSRPVEFDVSIACNSIVKDHKALSTFKPKIVVAADPVFHVGPSKYAEQFRKDLIALIDNDRNVHFVAPLHHKIIYDSIFVEKLKNRASYLKAEPSSHPNLNLCKSDVIRPTNNVLTFLMLPIATTIASEILYAGFDGNRNAPITYFWKHNRNSQYHEHIRSAKAIDRSFFKRSFKNYYKNHKDELSSYLQIIENSGVNMKTLTDTHIECLKHYLT